MPHSALVSSPAVGTRRFACWFGVMTALAAASPAFSLGSGDEMGLLNVREVVLSACAEEGIDCEGIGADGVKSRAMQDGGLRHYHFDVKFSDGSEIGIHRVVKVTGSGGLTVQPAATLQSVMLAHGDVWSFEPAFMPSAHSSSGSVGSPLAGSLPEMLAQDDFDVWGIDFGWTHLSTGADTSVLAGWGVDRDARDLTLAMSVARRIRGLGSNRMHLIAWSRGAITGYAAASLDGARPGLLRNLRSFIPVDIYVESPFAAQRAKACTRLAANQAAIAGGVYANDSTLIGLLGQWAVSSPSGASPAFPGFTNAVAANFVAAATYALLAPNEPTPFYHLFAGTWDATGPVGLTYSDTARVYQLMAAASPYEPLQLMADSDAATCDDPAADVAFDDRLAAIRVPLLYVGAAGGFGASGVFTAAQTSSAIRQSHVVQLDTAANSLYDIGHADIFHARSARSLFWTAMRDFMKAN